MPIRMVILSERSRSTTPRCSHFRRGTELTSYALCSSIRVCGFDDLFKDSSVPKLYPQGRGLLIGVWAQDG